MLTERLSGKRVVVCAGSGGVGKTTCSAAIALGLAARGQRVAVVTIDPAKRLADALGVDELGNEPHRIDPARFAGHGIEVSGELWAIMLDVKRTFDELIERLAPERDRGEERLLFHGQLREAGMPSGGLVVSRVQPADGLAAAPLAVERELGGRLGGELARKVAATYAEAQVVARRDAASLAHLR